jgi:topoisomerase-4 subunit A
MEDIELDSNGDELIKLHSFTEQAYLNYSMSVITDRALPHIGDGLKPVQRRIIYAMHNLGMRPDTPYRKAARTVGKVIGEFHPHGDVSCYEAMVLMAQNFSYRYPFVDGQGNWGSRDNPKSFASMRYTESRLAPFADILLRELNLGTVEWQPNFDGSIEEPKVMPSLLPNVLLNGAIGIAVGMATSIPPHNARELANACVDLLDNPEITLHELMKHIPAPDYPARAEIITPVSEIEQIYSTGRGTIRMRATYVVENGNVIVTNLPYQASSSRIVKQIADLMEGSGGQSKFTLVSDVRDESDYKNECRLVIVPRSNRVDIHKMMLHLFATTDLQKSYQVNMNIIGLEGKPKVYSLKEILVEWLKFRRTTVVNRINSRLEKVNARLHLIEGLFIAILNIDEVIRIIRTSDNPKEELMKRFALDEIQTEYILETKLRQLARLADIKLREEQKELLEEKEKLEGYLSSDKKLNALIKKEIQQCARDYGDDRMSSVVTRDEAKVISEKELLPSEILTVVLSEKGWIRTAKGSDVDVRGLSYMTGDCFAFSAVGRSNQELVFLTELGRAYSLDPASLPSARGKGEPLTGRFDFEPGDRTAGMMIGDESDSYLIYSDAGYGFITTMGTMLCANRKGKAVLSVPQGGIVQPPIKLDPEVHTRLLTVTSSGRMLVSSLEGIPRLAKGKGGRFIGLPARVVAERSEYVTRVVLLNESATVVIYAGKRKFTLDPSELETYFGEGSSKGQKLPRGLQNVDDIEVNFSVKERKEQET